MIHRWTYASRPILDLSHPPGDAPCAAPGAAGYPLATGHVATGSPGLRNPSRPPTPRPCPFPLPTPAAPREYCRGASRLEMSAPDVGALLERIAAEHPRLYPNICHETGVVRPHINVFVNHDSVRDGAGLR